MHLKTIACALAAATAAFAEEEFVGFAEGGEIVADSGFAGIPPPADAPYRDPSLDIEKRIDDLLPRLTDEEKAHLVHATGTDTMGHIPRIGLATFRTPDAGGGARAEKRPGITYFPAPIAYAAAFDRALAFEIGRAMGEETRAVYPAGLDANGIGRMLLGPGVNIARTPLGARNFEYFGEDPRLTGEIAASWTEGLQSVRVAPCMKHYCFNDQEADRTIINVLCGDRAAREIYMRPFEIAVRRADPWAYMSGYNKFRGRWTSQNAELNDVLLREYGATGALVPDWGGVHGMPSAINAGTTIESHTKENPDRDREDVRLLAEGVIDRARFDEAVRRALRLYFRVGAFDADTAGERELQAKCEASFRSDAHRSLARRAAEEGFVMVKNDGFLPFAGGKVAVVGPLADVKHAMHDKDTSLRRHGGSGAVKAAAEITPLEGFRAVFGAENVVTGADAAAAAAGADIVIYCAGTDHSLDREVLGRGHIVPHDRPGILLPKSGRIAQDDEILAVADANPNLVVLLNGGAPLSVEKWHGRAKAIFVTWYGGEFGGEVAARMVRGDVNPSGRLPYTYGRDVRDWPAVRLGERSYPGVWPGRKPWRKGGKWKYEGEPTVEYLDGIWVGYRGFDRDGVEPRYPFGHGLSYTEWETSAPEAVRSGDSFEVTCRVRNAGRMAGRRSVLLWASKPDQPDAEMPRRELVAFDSVVLAPGESAEVRFKVGFEELKYWSEADSCWKMPAGEIAFAVD